MRIKITLAVVLVASLFIMGCEAKNTKTLNPKIGFEIRQFELQFKDGGSYKSYSGTATIVPVGDPELVKKPYLVFVRCEKTKGGDVTEDKKDIKTIELVDGIGKFETYDSSNKKDDKFEKPEYKFSIIGYIPLIPLSNDPSKNDKISFELKEFKVAYKETPFLSDDFFKGYFGEGTIISVGDPELVKKPYIILIRFERTQGGVVNSANTKYMQHLTMVGGIVKIVTNDFTISSGKESVKEKVQKPEYKIEIIGYRPIEA